jgi:hypothetical protein
MEPNRKYIPILPDAGALRLNPDHGTGPMDLTKRVATAEQIQAEIAIRLGSAALREGRCRGCAVPQPVLLLERRGDGVNWSIQEFPAVPEGCAAFLMKVLSDVMFSYDLVAPSSSRDTSNDGSPPHPVVTTGKSTRRCARAAGIPSAGIMAQLEKRAAGRD